MTPEQPEMIEEIVERYHRAASAWEMAVDREIASLANSRGRDSDALLIALGREAARRSNPGAWVDLVDATIAYETASASLRVLEVQTQQQALAMRTTVGDPPKILL